MTSDQKVAIITGGAGIGKATASRFVKENIRVLIADLSAEDAARVSSELRAKGGDVLFQQGSVANEADCQAWAKAALDAWGRIDILVANAGARVLGGLLEATEEDWRLMLDVNLKGAAYCCKAVLPTMMKQHSGAIVMVSSAYAVVGRPEMPLYDAAKAGLLSLTRSLAVAYGKEGIRVNAVCPGLTITDFHEKLAAARGETPQELRARSKGYALIGRPAEPYELAAAIYFLASDEASNITGQSIFVDGGLSVTSAAAG